MNRNQMIKCDVYDCKYCDCECDVCSLKSIKISNLMVREKKKQLCVLVIKKKTSDELVK